MWLMKISIPYRESALLSKLAKKHKISVMGYPISSKIKKDAVYVITSGIYLGDKIKEFYKDMKKDPRTIKLEVKGNFGIAYIKQHKANKYLFDHEVIHVKPSIITKEGEYIFELASWNKEKLMNIIKAYKVFGVKLHYIKKKKLGNVQVLNIFPNLTEKQKKCLEIAISNGYYNFPRDTDLKSLAKIIGVSYSTYQFYLRTAEKKVMPSLYSNL